MFLHFELTKNKFPIEYLNYLVKLFLQPHILITELTKILLFAPY